MEPLHEPPSPITQAVKSSKPRRCGLPRPLPSSAEENRGLGHIHIYVIARAVWYLCPGRDHDLSANRNAYGSPTIQLVGEARRHSFACTHLSGRGVGRILIRRITRKGQPCRGKHGENAYKNLARRYPPPAPGRRTCWPSTPEEGDLRPFPSLPRVQTPGSSLSPPVGGRAQASALLVRGG